jgi:hypothetical protein
MATRGCQGTPLRVGDSLDLGPFDALCGELGARRIDSVIPEIQQGTGRGRILGFVRGLRVSAHLIYAIRDALSGTDLEADWGHILDGEGISCSPECDVIIHRRGWKTRWNGRHDPVMDFKFIESSKAVAVVSCKSYVTRIGQEHRDYCTRVKRYARRVWFFGECCNPEAVARLTRAARSAGYAGFWYLYAWDGKRSIEPNRQGWLDFLRALRQLAAPSSPRGTRK